MYHYFIFFVLSCFEPFQWVSSPYDPAAGKQKAQAAAERVHTRTYSQLTWRVGCQVMSIHWRVVSGSTAERPGQTCIQEGEKENPIFRSSSRILEEPNVGLFLKTSSERLTALIWNSEQISSANTVQYMELPGQYMACSSGKYSNVYFAWIWQMSPNKNPKSSNGINTWM